MAFPTTTINISNVDEDIDAPSNARSDIEALINSYNNLVQSRNAANGVVVLDGGGKILANMYAPLDLLGALVSVDGAGTDLDADKLDGKQGIEYPLVDGSRSFLWNSTNTEGQEFERSGTTNGLIEPMLNLYHRTTLTPGVNFGSSIVFSLDNSGNTLTLAGHVGFAWNDDDAGTEDSYFTVMAVSGGTPAEQLRIHDKLIELKEIVTPSGSPDSGTIYFYGTTAGLYYKLSNGTVVGPLASAAGGANHNTLTNLTVGDVHTQYFRTDGTRTMTGDIETGQNCIRFEERGSDPTVAAGFGKLYAKDDGVYWFQDGVATNLITAGGGTSDHNALDNLDVGNPHTQYILHQPTAHQVINDSGGAFDLRIEGDTAANLFYLYAAEDKVFINSPSGLSIEGRFNVVGGTVHGITASATGGGTRAMYALSSGAYGLFSESTGADTIAGMFYRVDASTGPLVRIEDATAAAMDGGLLELIGDTGTTGSFMKMLLGANTLVSVTNTEFVINESGIGTFDFRIESDSNTQLFFADASAEKISIFTTSQAARVTIAGGGIAALEVSGTGLVDVGRFTTDLGTALEVVSTDTAGTGTALNILSRVGYGINAVRSEQGTVQPFNLMKLAHASDVGTCLQLDTANESAVLLNMTLGGSNPIFAMQGTGTLLWKQSIIDPVSPPGVNLLYFYSKDDKLHLMNPAGDVEQIASGLGTNVGDILSWDGTNWAVGTASGTGASSLNGARTYDEFRESTPTAPSGTDVELEPTMAGELIKAGEWAEAVTLRGEGIIGPTIVNLGTEVDPQVFGREVPVNAGVIEIMGNHNDGNGRRYPEDTAVIIQSADGVPFTGGIVIATAHIRRHTPVTSV